MEQDDLPLAVRRTRRSLGATQESSKAGHSLGTRSSAAFPTPARTPKRKVRFSDPGPAMTPKSTHGPSSTGLTPMVRRTTIAQSSAGRDRRRSAPAGPVCGNGVSAQASSSPNEVHFLPLRQVLDGRIQRRIRRNGLSEEMNVIGEDKKRRAQEVQDEMNRLRAQIKEKDAEIYQLQNATIVVDTDRIWDLEKQVEDLREQLDNRTVHNSRTYNWTLAAKEPYAAEFMMDTAEDEDGFGEATMAELACSTPTRARASFPSPPLTSPVTVPGTPTHRQAKGGGSIPPTPESRHTAVQANLPDPEKQRLEEELASLQLEMTKMAGTLESYTSLSDRLSGLLAAFTPSGAHAVDEPVQVLESKLDLLFQTLSDKSAALLDLTTSITQLGFPGDDASDVVHSLSSAMRSARLELEYLTPGEIALPLTSQGAEVLDLLLTRLRDLAKKSREDEASIDEYHALELSLRQQLGARVDAMNGLNAELAKAKKALGQRDEKIRDLEVSVDRLKGATSVYIRDISELEQLVERMDGENRETVAAKDAQIESDKRELEKKEDSVRALENKLEEAVEQTAALLKEIEDVETAKDKQAAAMNKKSGDALALRDARVMELRCEIDRVNSALRKAHDTIQGLRVEKSGLEKNLAEEKRRAKAVIGSLKAELEKVVNSSQEMLSTSGKGESGKSSGPSDDTRSPETGDRSVERRGSILAGHLAKKPVASRKRRRYDSGLGFLEEDEQESIEA